MVIPLFSHEEPNIWRPRRIPQVNAVHPSHLLADGEGSRQRFRLWLGERSNLLPGQILKDFLP